MQQRGGAGGAAHRPEAADVGEEEVVAGDGEVQRRHVGLDLDGRADGGGELPEGDVAGGVVGVEVDRVLEDGHRPVGGEALEAGGGDGGGAGGGAVALPQRDTHVGGVGPADEVERAVEVDQVGNAVVLDGGVDLDGAG